MALDGVPWAIGGDAEHGPEVARQLAYLATGGKQGVGGASDLKVVPLDVPGAGVKVLSGIGSILNRVASKEAYSIRNAEADAESVKIGATGSSGGRSDLVIARVDNPYVDSNAQDPADPVHGPYNRFDVVAGVPAGTKSLQELDQYKGLSAIELARIDLNASDGTVTAAKIVDLRQVANPGRERQTYQQAMMNFSTLTSSTDVPFPATSNTSWPTALVPAFATQAVVRATLVGVTVDTAATAGYLSARIGTGTETATRGSYYNEQTANGTRRNFIIEDTVPIPAALRGTSQRLYVYGRRSGGTGALRVATDAQIFWDVEFIEAAA